MPMGALNSAPIFVAMMLTLRQKWDHLADKQGIVKCRSKVIVDDMLVYGRDPDSLLRYFKVVLEVLKHHRATVKLQKCKWVRD